jgi:uncharacterized SAM-binding protein YcdF (DUF218 family)
MADQLRQLGIPTERMVLDAASATTAQSASNLATIVGGGPVLLVTSAGHMARSVEALQRHGIQAVPVPTDYQLPQSWRQASWGPGALHLYASDLAMHERVGRLWYRIRSGG